MTNDSTDNLASEVFHESHRITPNSSEEKRPNEIKIASIETGTEGSEQILGVLTILMAAISILAGIGIAIFSAWTSPAFNNWWTEIKPSYGLIDQRE